MITCPWCGTNYTTFQSNCKNCGGPLSLPSSAAAQLDELPPPPPAPRPISGRYVWKLLFADGWFITAMVFGIISMFSVNHSVQVNGRSPCDIAYQFRALGRDYQGSVTTLNTPGPHLQPGRAVYVLYLPNAPENNAIYPHP